MKKGLFRKGLVLGIIVLFIGAGIIPSTVGIQKEKKSIQIIGSPGYIQDLIDNASDGDTITIPSGTYYENIVINKSISIIGEDKNTTIIYGNGSRDVVYISADKVTVSGFTIQNGGDGIHVDGNKNIIKNNNIELNNRSGILIYASDYNLVLGNTISFNNNGIMLYGWYILYLYEYSEWNIVRRNNITNNKQGIYLTLSSRNFILKNNFIDNEQDAFFQTARYNRWRRNYWNESRIFPKIIWGERHVGQGIFRPRINIDWRPAGEPYDI